MIQHLDRLLAREGPTHQLGLLRVGLALIVWAEYGHATALFWNHPGPRMLIGGALLVAAGFMAVGLFSRLSTAATGALLLLGYHWIGVHQGIKEPWVHAHTYLLTMAVLVLALAPNGRSLSLDRWRAGAGAAPQHGPLWPLALLRLQLALVYFWGAVDKTNVAFLSGSRLQQIGALYYGSHEGVRLPLFDELMVVASIGTVLLEYALAFGLWFAPARRWLIPLGIGFHAVVYLTLPVGTFSVTSCLLYLAFVRPEAVRDALHRLVGRHDEPPRNRETR